MDILMITFTAQFEVQLAVEVPLNKINPQSILREPKILSLFKQWQNYN